jgi:hypothetical protein
MEQGPLDPNFWISRKSLSTISDQARKSLSQQGLAPCTYQTSNEIWHRLGIKPERLRFKIVKSQNKKGRLRQIIRDFWTNNRTKQILIYSNRATTAQLIVDGVLSPKHMAFDLVGGEGDMMKKRLFFSRGDNALNDEICKALKSTDVLVRYQ